MPARSTRHIEPLLPGSGSQTVAPTGISRSPAVGTPAITTTITVVPTGISRTPVVGTPSLTVGAVTVTPTGIARTPVVGTPALIPGSVTVEPQAITRTPVVGTPDITTTTTVTPTGVSRTPVVGVPLISQPSQASLVLVGIGTSAAVGRVSVAGGRPQVAHRRDRPRRGTWA